MTEQEQRLLLSTFLKNRKIDAEVISSDFKLPFHKFYLRLGPNGKIRSLEANQVELGLALKSANPPIISVSGADGLVCLETVSGDHPIVHFDELIESSGFSQASILEQYELPALLGTTDVDKPLIVDLVKFPHLLIAGTTGSGKSVLMHDIIQSLEYHATKNKVQLVLIDPKFVEFTAYTKSKNLRYEVATKPRVIEEVLSDLASDMDKRLEMLQESGCRNLKEYRAKFGKGSYIVVVIDELADLMKTAKKKFEENLSRLCAKGRAAGIHVVVATQYPHNTVVTGTIKANFDGRIACRVSEDVHSRVILGKNGAEVLVGNGDALLSGGGYDTQRFRGALVQVAQEQPGFFSKVKGLKNFFQKGID